MEKFIVILRVLTLFILVVSCQTKFSKPIRYISEIEEVRQVVIIYSKGGEDYKKVIDDSEKVADFINLFLPSKAQYSDKKDLLSAPDSFDGRIEIMYMKNNVLNIDYSLGCCYMVKIDGEYHYEPFTYRLGNYLGSVHSKL